MRSFTCFICIVLLSFSLYAEQSKIYILQDSLLNIHDSLKFELLEDIADEFYYAGKLTESAEKYKEARIFEEQSKNSNTLRLANCLSNEAYCYFEIGYYNMAIPLYKKSLQLFKNINDLEEQATQLHNIGVSYFNMGAYSQSISYYQQALDIDKQRNDTNGMGISYSVLANVFSEWKKYDNAIELLHLSLDIAYQIDNKNQISKRLGKIGGAYCHAEQYDSALFYFEKSLPIIIELKDNNAQVICLTQIGDVYNLLGKYKQAQKYYEEAIEIAKQIEHLKAKAILYSQFGCNCIQLGKTKTGVDYLFKSLEISEKINLHHTSQKSYSYLSDYYYKKGDYKKAYDFSEKFYVLKEQTFTNTSQKQLAEFEALYETNQKEATIKDLEQQQQLKNLQIKNANSRRNFALLVAFVAVVALITSVFISRKLKSKNIELANLNGTLKRMFSIISHDLKGSVVSFQSAGRIMNHHLKKNEFEKLALPANEVKERSLQLTQMLDNLLNWSLSQIKQKQNKPTSTNVLEVVNTEIELFQNTAQIKNIEIITEIPSSTTVFCDAQHFAIVLRNLINNAIKFTENGKINVSAKNEENQLLLTIVDTGIGIEPNLISSICEISEKKIKHGTRNEKGTGLGLNLVKEFVELNKGKLEFESEVNKGTKITLYLPLN